MALQEYAIVDGDRIGGFKMLDSDHVATLPPGKRADLKPVTRTNATIDPVTQRLGSESITIGADAVTITRDAVDLPPLTIRDNRTATVDPARRERIQMRAISLLGIAVRTPQQQTRLDRMLAWVNYWLELDRVGQALHADPQANETWPDEPAGGAP